MEAIKLSTGISGCNAPDVPIRIRFKDVRDGLISLVDEGSFVALKPDAVASVVALLIEHAERCEGR